MEIKKLFYSENDNGENSYFFSPSIGRRKNVSGKTYFVRGYFTGDKDFEKTMEDLAIQHAYAENEVIL